MISSIFILVALLVFTSICSYALNTSTSHHLGAANEPCDFLIRVSCYEQQPRDDTKLRIMMKQADDQNDTDTGATVTSEKVPDSFVTLFTVGGIGQAVLWNKQSYFEITNLCSAGDYTAFYTKYVDYNESYTFFPGSDTSVFTWRYPGKKHFSRKF